MKKIYFDELYDGQEEQNEQLAMSKRQFACSLNMILPRSFDVVFHCLLSIAYTRLPPH